jgi:hypothetical protein
VDKTRQQGVDPFYPKGGRALGKEDRPLRQRIIECLVTSTVQLLQKKM